MSSKITMIAEQHRLPGMGGTDQGLSESSGRHEHCQLVFLLRTHKSELLLPTPSGAVSQL
jgi:hypothetical protein